MSAGVNVEPTPTDTKARERPIEVALDAALIVMRNGGSTVAADRTFRNILKGYRRDDVSAVWRLDFIAATSADKGRSSTIVAPVGPIGVNLVRAAEVAALSRRAAEGTVPLALLATEMERIKNLPSPYHRWTTIATAAAIAACFSQIAGGDWGSFGLAFVAAGIGQFLRSILQARERAVAPVTLISGVVSAMIAGIGLRLGLSQMEAAALIASVIYLVPGLPLINGFVDLISHRYLIVGAQRILNAVFLFLILAIAIALAHTIVP